MSDFKLKPTFHLLLSPLISLILIGCSAPNGYSDSFDTAGLDSTVELEATRKTQTSVSTKNDINLEHFKPLFEGGIAERADALGEGPYKIGTPITGYASDYIKTYFEHYDHDLRFTQQLNFDEDICNFSKAALFSDQIDLSEFYWHHPTEEQSPLQKIDNDLYYLTDDSGLYIHFTYDDFAFSINDEPIRLANSWLYLCQFGDNPEIKYSELNDAIDIYTTIKINKGRCDYEYDTDTAPIFSRNYPGSTIGFFWSKDDLYIISVQLFDYGIYNTRSIERSSVAITTSKVNYESNGQMRGFAATCVYKGNLPEK